jgi:hypothetical protein
MAGDCCLFPLRPSGRRIDGIAMRVVHKISRASFDLALYWNIMFKMAAAALVSSVENMGARMRVEQRHSAAAKK